MTELKAKCQKCGENKDYKDLYTSSGNLILGGCRQCKYETWRQSYIRNRETVLARNDSYRKRNQRRVQAVANKRAVTTDIEKTTARYQVKQAVIRGGFEKTSCVECGDGKVHFHHSSGYDKENWFTGQWLCHYHHKLAHGHIPMKTALQAKRKELEDG